MAGYSSAVQLNIISSGSGDVLASLSVEPSLQVAEVTKQLAETVGDPWRVYHLIYGSKPLQAEEVLKDVLDDSTAVTLVAVKQSLLRISCPVPLVSAAFLPSQDLLLVTKGNITSSKDEDVKVLGDDSEIPIFWFWRLSHASGWSFEKAVLLARTCPLTSPSMLYSCWEVEKDENVESYSPWTAEEKEEQKRTGIIKLSARMIKQASLFLRVHDESSAVFTWNQSDYFGGCAFLERFDLVTGKVTRLASIVDAWDVATDPSDPESRFFYTTCYDGTDVQTMDHGTVAKPTTDRGSRILSQAVGLGFSLCYDTSLKVLVASGNRSASCFLIAPPGGIAHVQDFPGAEVVESLRPPADDHTPGDRSSPWETVMVPLGAKIVAVDMGLSAENGCLTYIDEVKREVCTTDLSKGTTVTVPTPPAAPPVFVARCGELIAVFTE